MKIVFVLLIGVATVFNCSAEKVRLYGKAVSYAGNTIDVLSHTDSFLYQDEKLTQFSVDAQGAFSFELEITEPQLIFLPLGIYQGYLYVEPGKKYEIKLPPKVALSPAQKLNPFFEPDELMLGVANGGADEINLLIRKFDDKLDAFINQNFNKIYRKKEQSVGWDYAKQLKEEYSAVSDPFFRTYFTYRLGFLEFLAFPNSFVRIENKYFKDQPLQLNNPAYMSLYKKQYGNFLNAYFNQVEGAALQAAFASENPFAKISESMQKYPAYQNAPFRRLIIATSIFDSYTRKFIGRKQALQIFKSIAKASTSAYNKKLCQGYIAKLTHLQKNYPAPDFNIGDIRLSDYRGKYLYLNFCNTQSYPCLQDFKEIEKLKKQFGKYIEFLSISCDWKASKLDAFLQKNLYSWTFVHIANQHHLIHDYNVKAFPSYVLIDPKGNIVKAPAPGPRENIRQEFIKIARDVMRMDSKK